MNKTLFRYMSFLIGCMGTRIGLGLYIQSNHFLHSRYIYTILHIAITLMGLGFIIIYLGGLRKTGIETNGQPIWWNSLRPFHGIMYIFVSWLLFHRTKSNLYTASHILIVDAMIGLIAWLVYHFSSFKF